MHLTGIALSSADRRNDQVLAKLWVKYLNYKQTCPG